MVPVSPTIDLPPPPAPAGALRDAARAELIELRADLRTAQAALALAERARLDATMALDVGYGPKLRLTTFGRSADSQARLIAFLRAEAAEMAALEPHLAALVEG